MKNYKIAVLTLAALIALTGCGQNAGKEGDGKPEQSPENKQIEQQKPDSKTKSVAQTKKKPDYKEKSYTIDEVKQALNKKYLNFEQNYVFESQSAGGGYCFVSQTNSSDNPPVQVNPYTGNYYDLQTEGFVDEVLKSETGKPVTLETLNDQLKAAPFLELKEGDSVTFATYLLGDAIYEMTISAEKNKQTLRINLATGDVYDFETEQWLGIL